LVRWPEFGRLHVSELRDDVNHEGRLVVVHGAGRQGRGVTRGDQAALKGDEAQAHVGDGSSDVSAAVKLAGLALGLTPVIAQAVVLARDDRVVRVSIPAMLDVHPQTEVGVGKSLPAHQATPTASQFGSALLASGAVMPRCFR